MFVNERLQIRVTSADKAALAERAEAEGITLSMLLRRGLRLALGQPVRLNGDDALEVVALRRRINAISSRLDLIERQAPEAIAMRADIAQARADAQALLGRGP